MIFIFSWLVQVKVLTYLILLRGLIRDPGLKNSKSIHKIQVKLKHMKIVIKKNMIVLVWVS